MTLITQLQRLLRRELHCSREPEPAAPSPHTRGLAHWAHTPPALSHEQWAGSVVSGAWPVLSGVAGGRGPRNTVAGFWGMPPAPKGAEKIHEGSGR